ncbi:hypothetical protein [Modestobacter sp. NPDC049651]|uniref:hypothetical protein n=1 Tax=unclassified Modestobacter TaxID=2643866 RepID=UPI003401953C
MSTDNPGPTEPNWAGPSEPNVAGHAPGAAPATGPTEQLTDGSPDGPAADEQREPGWVTRNTTLLITLLLAVIVAGCAVIGVGVYRHNQNEADKDTEAAFRTNVSAQGATVETVECNGDTCRAVIGGQAYSVLVQEDAKGKKHFGVAAFNGR